jgi:radical SAM/Cys-rich protein
MLAAAEAGTGAERAWGFGDFVERFETGGLRRDRVTTLQLNVGKLCNMACHHCHVDAGPKRKEIMSGRVAERVLEILATNPAVRTLDLTGGAPELNPEFRRMVTEARRLGRRVVDRCNLTVLHEPGQEGLVEFLAANRVHVVASLPCYGEENVDRQRGGGAFAKSIRALQELNELGYGRMGSELELDLAYNPVGAFLPPAEAELETRYRDELWRNFGIRFNRLLTITNMPISRFAAALRRNGQLEAYMGLLVNHFNPATLPALMCRTLLSVAWDGAVYDCDFNQMLGIPIGALRPRTIWDLTQLDSLTGKLIATGAHCFGCTAGAGSSCSGALRAQRQALWGADSFCDRAAP